MKYPNSGTQLKIEVFLFFGIIWHKICFWYFT